MQYLLNDKKVGEKSPNWLRCAVYGAVKHVNSKLFASGQTIKNTKVRCQNFDFRWPPSLGGGHKNPLLDGLLSIIRPALTPTVLLCAVYGAVKHVNSKLFASGQTIKNTKVRCQGYQLCFYATNWLILTYFYPNFAIIKWEKLHVNSKLFASG